MDDNDKKEGVITTAQDALVLKQEGVFTSMWARLTLLELFKACPSE
jgi:hypothetical protein